VSDSLLIAGGGRGGILGVDSALSGPLIAYEAEESYSTVGTQDQSVRV